MERRSLPGLCRPVRCLTVARREPRGGRISMSSRRIRRGPGPSHVLITPDHAGNVVGVDPHKRTLTATVVDPRGGIVAAEHFRSRATGIGRLRCGRASSGRSRGGGSRAFRRGVATRRCSWLAVTMTCVTCARIALRGTIARVSAVSPTRSIASGSRGRCSRTRCCPRRSSARAATPDPTNRPSCWRCGGTRAAR